MSAVSTAVLLPEKSVAAPPRTGRPRRWLTRQGRCGVLAYHGRFVLIALLVALVSIGATLLFRQRGGLSESGEPSDTMMMVFVLTLGASVLVMLPIALVAVLQRLHDLNLNGWWALLALVPVVGTAFGLYVGLAPGRGEANRFGEWRAPSGVEKVFGILGLVVLVPVLVGVLVMGASDHFSL